RAVIAILWRELREICTKKRFFLTRAIVVASPVLLVTFFLDESQDADRMGREIFAIGTGTLLIILMLVTPGMVASVLAEERHNNKLEVLSSAPISLRGIVLGKWSARTAPIFVMALAALPFPASGLLFGGFAPSQFLMASLVVFATVFVMSAVSVWLGAGTSSLGTAARNAYLVLFGWCLVMSIIPTMLDLQRGPKPPFTLSSLSLNPFIAMAAAVSPAGVGAAPAPFGLSMPSFYGMSALVVGTAFLLLTPARLRRVVRRSARKASRVGPAGDAGIVAPRREGLLDRRPMLWLDLERHGGIVRMLMRRRVVLITVLLLEGFFVWQLMLQNGGGRAPGRQDLVFHVTAVGGVCFMTYLAAIASGASAFHRDAEARTLEVLHATPLETSELVGARVMSVLRGVAPLWGLAVLHFAFGVVASDLKFLGLVFFVPLTWLVTVAAVAFGCWCSLTTDKASRAVTKAFLIAAVLFIVWPILVVAMFVNSSSGETAAVLLLGQNPVYMTLFGPGFADYLLSSNHGRSDDGITLLSFGWVAVYLAFVYWVLANQLGWLYHRKRALNWGPGR
ncbi:MAG: hypothetical protein KDB53_16850, partial [Planctomycetes bacterium]|nr:hypothetical protein [Planctomycetota bacterium]